VSVLGVSSLNEARRLQLEAEGHILEQCWKSFNVVISEAVLDHFKASHRP
jgi:hypothetical protein